MAHIEINALSVKLAGTFEAHVFFSEINILMTEKEFPVLWMIHEDGKGTFDLVRYARLFERIANEKKMFIIAPAVSHSLATNMVYGTDNEDFLANECVEIFRFMYPLSRKKEDNYIFGIHTGAYGAVKLAMKHEDVYGGCFAVNGELDIVKRCQDIENKETGFVHQSAESLKAIFGNISAVQGSAEDIYTLAETSEANIFLLCSNKVKSYEDNIRLANSGSHIILKSSNETEDFTTIETMIEKGINYLTK